MPDMLIGFVAGAAVCIVVMLVSHRAALCARDRKPLISFTTRKDDEDIAIHKDELNSRL
ncbi:MAG: hypothetical protein AAGI37_19720 [Planctomycetota bacterium]